MSSHDCLTMFGKFGWEVYIVSSPKALGLLLATVGLSGSRSGQ